jgi:predicted nucleotidyltransferase
VTSLSYPGTAAHQAVLRAFSSHYAADPRVLFVGLFGSLARGNWTPDSDVDLTIVVGDDVKLEPVDEVARVGSLLSASGDPPLMLLPDGDEAAYALLQSMIGLSVRFHRLDQTSPHVVSSLRRLAGALPMDAVAAAGQANQQRSRPPLTLSQLVDETLSYALESAAAVHRGRLWLALELLARARARVMTVYTRAHGGERPVQFFDDNASAALKEMLGRSLPEYGAADIYSALGHLLDLVEAELGTLGGGEVALAEAQRAVMAEVRRRIG